MNLHMRDSEGGRIRAILAGITAEKMGVEQTAAGARFIVTLLGFTVSFISFIVSLGEVAF